MKTHELQAMIDERIKSLAAATDQALASQAVRDFFKTLSRFHHYSAQNVLLIQFAMPAATRVAGYNAWLKMKRYVKRGEKGIPILAPLVAKGEDGSAEVKGFKVVYVFDISQTEGEPLPEPPDWKSPERQLALESRLVELAMSQGITVKRKQLQGSTQGLSRHGAIELAEEAGTQTLIHEIAHELLHWDKDDKVDRQTQELEAETVAWIVADHFGLEGLHSANYLALWGIDSDKIMKRMNRIRAVVSKIISFLEQENVPTPELEPVPAVA